MMLAARSIASCLIVGLMLAISPTSASTRSGPKSLTTLKALIVGDPSYSSVGVMLAINDINNNRPTVLPDVTLVADRIDANLTNPGTTYRQFLELAKLSTYSLWAGPLSTELTTASTLFASYKNILSFSPTANSTIFSDKTVYGSFWRYTNPVENLALPSIALLKHFNWTDVVLTWVEGTEGATLADTFSTTAIANNITMVAKVPFAISPDKDLYMQTLGPLKFIRSTKARIIVLAGGPSAGIDIMIAANRLGMINNGYVWISLQSLFSPDFARQQSYWGSEFNPSILKGALQLLTPRGQNTTAMALTNFKSIFDSYVPLALSTNGAYFNCFTTTNASSPCFYPNALYEPETNNLVPAYNILSGYDGVMTAALAMDSVVDASFSTGASLKGPLGSNYGNVTLSSIVASALSYSCLSGISSFTVSGDPGVPYMITLWNGGSWVPSVAQVHVGTISVQVSGSSASPSVILDKSKYFWADGSLAMSGVPPQYPVLLEEYISWDTPDTKAIIAIYIVFWIILAATIVVLAIKGRSPDVRNISPHYLLLLTIGIAIASLNILTLPGKVKVAGCLWRPWPLSAGICIVFVAILAKAHHIYYVYDNIELYKLPSLLFNSPRIYLLVFAVSVVNGAILVAYLLKAPLLAVLNAPSQLGNARQLGYVVYISALLTLIVMVGGFSGISTVTTEFFVESIVVLFGLVTIYGFLVAAPLFGAVTGYVSKTLPGIQGFGTSRDNSGTTSAITSVSQNNAGQPAARGMRGRKRGTFKLTFKDELKEVGANLQTLFESINGTVHHREGFLQCTTHIVPTWSAVTVTLVLDGLNLLLCVGGSDDQTTEFNIANLISVEVLEKHPTESVPNCLILKQVTQTHILQLKSYAQVYTLAGAGQKDDTGRFRGTAYDVAKYRQGA
ncbi:hypothetical protein BSLG_009053 [Batrachochytrium salamandrivorans]|nr:hypothetical protein BSLG_009053 [Batrachochytrium salamandrivorans]